MERRPSPHLRIAHSLRGARRELLQQRKVCPDPAVGPQGLDANVIRTRVEVSLHTLTDRALVTPRHQCVHEPVTAIVGEVVVAEAEVAQIA
jgi:hypothetical protein